MINRVKQFYSALFAEVKAKENEFVDTYLNLKESELFYAMSVVDQRHALDVSYFVLKALKDKQVLEQKLLVKAALLHDVGKVNGDLTILDRTIIVLLEFLWPRRMQGWAKEGRGNFVQNRRHAFFVAINHGERGAVFLQGIGCEDQVIELVRYHHHQSISDWRMAVLQEADAKS